MSVSSALVLRQPTDLIPRRLDEFRVCVGVTPQPPSSIDGFGQEHPGPLLERVVTSGARDQLAELLDDRELFLPIKGARVRQHLHAHVALFTIDVARTSGAQLMDDLYETRVQPEGSIDKIILRDIPMGTDIIVPKGDLSLKIPAEMVQAIIDELEITDQEMKRGERDWPETEARALSRLQAAISDDRLEE